MMQTLPGLFNWNIMAMSVCVCVRVSVVRRSVRWVMRVIWERDLYCGANDGNCDDEIEYNEKSV